MFRGRLITFVSVCALKAHTHSVRLGIKRKKAGFVVFLTF